MWRFPFKLRGNQECHKDTSLGSMEKSKRIVFIQVSVQIKKVRIILPPSMCVCMKHIFVLINPKGIYEGTLNVSFFFF